MTKTLNTIIMEYYSITNNNIYGINAIQYVLFFITILKTNIFANIINVNLINELSIIKEDLYYDYFTKIKNKINNEYNIFNFDFDKSQHALLKKIINYTLEITISQDDCKKLISKCFQVYSNNENLNIVKDYVKYYNNQNLIKWIVDFIKIQNYESILDPNYKVNSFYDEIKGRQKKDDQISDINLYGIQFNKTLNGLCLLNNLLKFNESFCSDIGKNNILIDDIGVNNSGMYDLILFDMHHGIHNVIHANCCKKIKKIKLRGTKADSLLLQLTMLSLNKNGRCVMIVPDSLLFNDSIQTCETREYLLNNFNVKKIIQIDDSFYWGNTITRDIKSITSTIKNSILYFENNGKTKTIEFSKIVLNSDQVSETKLISLNFTSFEENRYSLYYKNYLESSINLSSKIEFGEVSKLFTISHKFEGNNNLAIGLEKTYNSINSINLINNTNNLGSFITFFTELESDKYIKDYLTYFLSYKLKLDPEKFTKGKTKQFDLEKINKIKIPVLSRLKQKAVCSYLNTTNLIISENNSKIQSCNDLINCLIDTIPMDKMISLGDIVTIQQGFEIDNVDNCIGIIKNGLSAGSVYLPLQQEKNNNSYYLVINDQLAYVKLYIYEYLKYSQNKLKEFAYLTAQPNLSKTNILNFKIPDIDFVSQTFLCSHIDIFNQTIEKYICSINDIKQKDIIATIIKINNF